MWWEVPVSDTVASVPVGERHPVAQLLGVERSYARAGAPVRALAALPSGELISGQATGELTTWQLTAARALQARGLRAAQEPAGKAAARIPL